MMAYFGEFSHAIVARTRGGTTAEEEAVYNVEYRLHHTATMPAKACFRYQRVVGNYL